MAESVANRGGQRGRFAPVGTLGGAAKKGKRKREKKEKGNIPIERKGKKERKRKYGRSMS